MKKSLPFLFAIQFFILLFSASASAQTISTGLVSGVNINFCTGVTFSISYSVTGTFINPNTFTAQLSDGAGSFAAPVAIGTFTSINSGNINVTFPGGTTPGTGYRIRVVSNNPVVTGTDNGTDLVINNCKILNANGNWNDGTKWTPAGIPTATDQVVVSAPRTVTVPAGYAAVAKDVMLTGQGKLVVAATGSLSINDAAGTNNNGNGIYINANGSSLTNAGTINIANTGGIGANGIYAMNTAAVSNSGTINVGSGAAVQGYGLYFISTSTLGNTGTIEINRAQTDGMRTGVNLTNDGTIRMGNAAAIAGNGLRVTGNTFTNSTTGVIEIDNIAAGEGVFNNGIVTNNGMLKIGQTTAVFNNGIRNFASGTVNNNGQLLIDRITTFDGIQNQGTFTNGATGVITIGATAPVFEDGIFNSNTFTNVAGGTINIGNIPQLDAIYQYSASLPGISFTNNGTINIGNTGPVTESGLKIRSGTFTNNSGGQIVIDSLPNTGAGLAAITMKGGSFSNAGTVTIGQSKSVKNGIGIDTTAGTFTNSGTLGFGTHVVLQSIDTLTTVTNNSGATVSLATGANLRILGTLSNGGGLSIASTDTLTVNGTLSNSGTVTNGGKLRGGGTIAQSGTFTNAAGSRIGPGNSPGNLTVNGSFDLGSATLDAEVNGPTAISQYDVLTVTGTATVGSATLNVILDPGYTPGNSDVITIVNAGTVTGTFGGTLPAGLAIKYNFPAAGQVSIGTPVALPLRLLSFSAAPAGAGNLILWKTGVEAPGCRFAIERSTDGVLFQPLGERAGEGAASTYQFQDEAPAAASYYRLRLTDERGAEDLSPVVLVRRVQSAGLVVAVPVPATNTLTITTTDPALTGQTATISDMQGREVCRFLLTGRNDLAVAGWPAGVYSLRLPSGEVVRVVKQ